MTSKKFLLLICLFACKEDKTESIFSSQELLAYESEQHKQSFNPEVNTNNKLDILLVIDNSGSMYTHHTNLSTKIEPLLKYINNSDWKIAITSSDTLDGIVNIITKDNQHEFEPTIGELGTNGIGDEAILFKAIQALKGTYIRNNDLGQEETQKHVSRIACMKKEPDCNPKKYCGPNVQPSCDCCNFHQPSGDINHCSESQEDEHKNWLRDDSMLAILLVTDEDHQCHDQEYGCTINDFYFYLKSIREPGATAQVYGLLSTNNSFSGNAGTTMGNKRFTDWHDGTNEKLFKSWAPIEDDDYGKILEEISGDIANSIKTSFTLDHAYDGEGETVVTVNYKDVDGVEKKSQLGKSEYRISGNTLTILGDLKRFKYIQNIEVSYSAGK